MAGRDAVSPQPHRMVQKGLELDLGIAEHVRIRGAAGLVLPQKFGKDTVLVLAGKVHMLDLNAQHIGHRCGIDKIDIGCTVFTVVVIFPVFHEDADDFVPLLLEQVSADRRVHAPAQAHYHPLFCCHVCDYREVTGSGIDLDRPPALVSWTNPVLFAAYPSPHRRTLTVLPFVLLGHALLIWLLIQNRWLVMSESTVTFMPPIMASIFLTPADSGQSAEQGSTTAKGTKQSLSKEELSLKPSRELAFGALRVQRSVPWLNTELLPELHTLHAVMSKFQMPDVGVVCVKAKV